MNIIRTKAVCFTGHRPEKLPDKGERSSLKTRVIKSMLYTEISAAVDDGYDTFITGMQRGIDLWAGEAVMDIMSRSPLPLRLVAVLPYKGFGENFTGEDKWVFGRILETADKTVTICESYTKSCMNQRNRFMVDSSARVIGVLSSGYERSGTGQTLRYAKSQGLEIRRIDPAALFAPLCSGGQEDNVQLRLDITPCKSSLMPEEDSDNKTDPADVSDWPYPTQDDSLELL